MAFEEKRKALGIQSDEELAADLERLLSEKEQIEKEQLETQRIREGLEAEMHFAKLLNNIVKIGQQMKVTKSEVEFEANGKPIKFTIIHDLLNMRGLSFDDAVNGWVCRTLEYTPESLCKYIMSKNTGHIAMTEEQFEKAKR